MAGPLDGLRVVDCSTGTAGSFATGLLGDYGADVIRVEPAAGDRWNDELRVAYSVFNRSKRSVKLDAGGKNRDQLLGVIGDADVLVTSWRPRVAERFGLTYSDLHPLFPGLICGTITGFGPMQQYRDIPGYESIVHAVVGTMAEQTGFRDGPIFEALPFASLGAGYLTVIGVLASLHRRFDDGIGRHVESSLIDGAVAYLTMLWGDTASARDAKNQSGELSPSGSSTRLICQSFRCSDDRYVGVHTGAVGAFGRLMTVLGLDDRIASRETGSDIGTPLTEREQEILHTEIHKIFAKETQSEWVDRLVAADICGIPQLDLGEVFDAPQTQVNGMVVEVDDLVLGRIQQVAPPIRFSRTADRMRHADEPDSALVEFGGEAWSRPDPRTVNTGPVLSGVKILDLGAFYAGPYGSRLLADLGADVIKVEPVAGDPMRGLAGLFRSAQAGKRAVAIDLKNPDLRPTLQSMLAWADIVHHNMRPGAAERIGVGYEQVSAVNPSVIYGYAPGWGSTGPFAMRQSFEPMMSGYVGAAYEVAGEYNPPIYPAGNADPGNGLLGACGMLMALVHRRRTGEGQYFEHPQLNATMMQVSHVVRRVNDQMMLGSSHLDVLQSGVDAMERLYQTADGWICIAVKQEPEVLALEAALGIEGLAASVGPRRPGDDDGDYRVMQTLSETFATRTTADWLKIAGPLGLAVVEPRPHNNLAFLLDPANFASGRSVECELPEGGPVREVGVLVTVSDSQRAPHRMAPTLGQDTEEILLAFGCDPQLLERLRTGGAAL